MCVLVANSLTFAQNQLALKRVALARKKNFLAIVKIERKEKYSHCSWSHCPSHHGLDLRYQQLIEMNADYYN